MTKASKKFKNYQNICEHNEGYIWQNVANIISGKRILKSYPPNLWNDPNVMNLSTLIQSSTWSYTMTIVQVEHTKQTQFKEEKFKLFGDLLMIWLYP